jgi:hypothetical protein
MYCINLRSRGSVGASSAKLLQGAFAGAAAACGATGASTQAPSSHEQVAPAFEEVYDEHQSVQALRLSSVPLKFLHCAAVPAGAPFSVKVP